MVKKVLKPVNLILLSLFFIAAGVNHFLLPQVYMRVMPPYLPYPLELIYVSGFFEILGGAGMLLPWTRRISGYLLVLLLIAVFPANVHMALHNDIFPSIPAALLWGRLFLQPLMMAWIWATVKGYRRVPS